MVTTQFEQGNYNEWYNSVIFLMPKINDLIRHDLLATLDETLLAMVGGYSDIKRDAIDMVYMLDDDAMSGITCKLSYIVDDFKVNNAPDEAVVTDQNAIKGMFEGKPYTIRELTIDKTTGKLSMTVDFFYKQLEDKKEENDKV